MISRTEVKFKIERIPMAYHEYEFKRIISKTDKAVHFRFDKGQDIWIPKKVIKYYSEQSNTVHLISRFLLDYFDKHEGVKNATARIGKGAI